MKDLLQFFEESIFTFSKTLLDRLKNLCNIITNLFIPENKSKSWFSKFIGILHEIEDFFMEDKTKNFFQIDKLQDLFKIFKDKKSE